MVTSQIAFHNDFDIIFFFNHIIHLRPKSLLELPWCVCARCWLHIEHIIVRLLFAANRFNLCTKMHTKCSFMVFQCVVYALRFPLFEQPNSSPYFRIKLTIILESVSLNWLQPALRSNSPWGQKRICNIFYSFAGA